MSKQLTKAEVAQHKDEKAMYIIVDDGVYDVAGMFPSLNPEDNEPVSA